VKNPTLTPTQITDLVNFVLGTTILVFVVKTWTGHQCYQVENWIDRVLRTVGLAPAIPKEKSGRRPGMEPMPVVLVGLVELRAKAKGAGR
jgi:predicted ATP-dependent Lon-type protease